MARRGPLPPLRECAGNCGRRLRSWKDVTWCAECVRREKSALTVEREERWAREGKAKGAVSDAPASLPPGTTRGQGNTIPY